jgi:hypothetical protein
MSLNGKTLVKGGIGEGYRAKDLTLGRDVAIKVLPLASLNNPNIAAILEESGGNSFDPDSDSEMISCFLVEFPQRRHGN